MNLVKLPGFTLVGLKLGHKTTNEGGRSGVDCGNLWQKFEKEDYLRRIPGKSGEEVYAVYFDYEGDHSQSFSYFIGCKVREGSEIPSDMETLIIPSQSYVQVTARGKMPECIANSWRDIWGMEISRAYHIDFEIYDERSRDWEDAEVEIFVSSE